VGRESSIISLSMKDEKFSSLFRFFYSRVYQNLDLIICQSKVMASDLIKNFKIKPSSVTVIYNPVDLELVAESVLQTDIPWSDKQEIQFLCVGRLYPVKGYDRLLRIVSTLSDFPYRLTIVGDGPLRQELEQLSLSLKIDSRVHFLGIQENPFKFMVNADCLLMSSYYEGLPNVVLEANACGLPVIAFNAAGGIGEIITEGLNGWLVDDGDEDEFAEKLSAKEYLQVDKGKIAAFVTERFSLPKITKQYEDAILSLRKRND
jgi:glycosyltransferase involved in cell wall biosynthesis